MGRITCKSKCCYGASIVVPDNIIDWLENHATGIDFRKVFDVEYDTKSWEIYGSRHKTEWTDET